MDSSDIIAITAGGISLISAGVAGWALRYAKQSADAADTAAKAAAETSHAENEREHRSHKPPQPDPPQFAYKPNPRTGEQNVFFTFNVPATYRVKGRSVRREHNTEATIDLSVPLVVEAGETHEVYIGDGDKDGVRTLPSRLTFHFWPPVPGDPGEVWTCPCGRSASEAEPPHWVWNVPVEPGVGYDLRKSFG